MAFVEGADMACVMFNIVVLMAIGYALNLIGPLQTSEQRRVLGMFITDLALPALFFQSLSQEDFRDTNLHMLSAVVIAKVGMLSSGWLFGRVAGSQSIAGSPQMYAGMFGLLSTNGDEVGLGVPAMTALFPDMMPVLYVLAGIQKMCFLPPALVMLGVSRELKDTAAKLEDGAAPAINPFKILLQVLRAKLRDPLVLGIVSGTVYNLVGPANLKPSAEHSWYPEPSWFGGAYVHPYVNMVCATLGSAFTPLIFVMTGASSVGTYAALLDYDNIVLPLTLVLTKSMVLPTAIRAILGLADVSDTVKDFAFIFGLFPASGANMVYIFAYSPDMRQKAALMGTIALSKIVTFPLLLLASRILFATDASDVTNDLATIDDVTQLWMLPFCLWTLGVLLWRTKNGQQQADAALVAWLVLESVALTGGLLEGFLVVQACQRAREVALLALACTHIYRLSGMEPVHAEAHGVLRAATEGDYVLMTNGRANAQTNTGFIAQTALMLGGAFLPGLALAYFGGGVPSSLSVPCLGSDASAPGLTAVAHAVCATLLGAGLLTLLNLDNAHDVRERDPAYHLHLQKVDVVLILSATLLLLSSTSLASLTTMPPGEAPAGSFAIMVSLVGFLRGARAIAAFVMFGSQPLMDCWFGAIEVARNSFWKYFLPIPR